LKIKCIPSDFQVDELIEFLIENHGDFAIYQVRKNDISTSELLKYLAKWTSKSLKHFSCAGMKDRHAITIQHISLKGDGPELIKTDSFSTKRIGYLSEPVKPKHLKGNSFKITIRDLSKKEVSKIEDNFHRLSEFGFPNYFDDQRFRSQKSTENIFGFYIFRREYENALKIYINEVLTIKKQINSKTQDNIFIEWGKWDKLSKLDLHISLKRIFQHLEKHKNDFQGAIFILDVIDLRMMISAAQSYIWNEILSSYLNLKIPGTLFSKKGAWQTYYFYQELSPEFLNLFSDLSIEMPHANWQNSNPEIKNILHNILTQYKLQLKDFTLTGFKKVFSNEHKRRSVIFPKQFKISDFEEDDLYPGRKKITISFELPPGSYATMLIKRLMI